MKKIDFQKVIAWLSFALRCPVCGYQYNLERTKIIDSKESEANQESQRQASLVVHSDCSKCNSSVVFSISINGPDVFSVGMVTDLTSEDSADFAHMDALAADDVLNMHYFLEQFDGNFVKVLQK